MAAECWHKDYKFGTKKRDPPHLVVNHASSDVSHTLWSKLTEAFKGLPEMLTSNRQLLINVTEWSDVLGKYFHGIHIGNVIQRLILQRSNKFKARENRIVPYLTSLFYWSMSFAAHQPKHSLTLYLSLLIHLSRQRKNWQLWWDAFNKTQKPLQSEAESSFTVPS